MRDRLHLRRKFFPKDQSDKGGQVQSFPDCQSGDINDYSTLAYRFLRTGEHNIFWLFDSLQGHVSKLFVYWPFLGIYINMYIYI